MTEVGEIVRAHHERWDGGGYPDGLAGEAIPLEARIITCCDSWSAMRTDRPYRGAMSYEAAAEQMIVHSGSQFDPTVVAAMLPVVAATDGPTAPGDRRGVRRRHSVGAAALRGGRSSSRCPAAS